MTREIKFRAWDGVRKRMFYNIEIHLLSNGSWEAVSGFIPGIQAADDNGVLMQYTGLKDKNGKEIYEGDIMQFAYKGKVSVSFVVWSLDGWRFNSYMLLGDLRLYPYVAASPSKYPKAEIIGNIYEHPELLQQKTQQQ